MKDRLGLALAIAALFAVVGCGSSQAPTASATPTPTEDADSKEAVSFPIPDFSQPSQLYMLTENGAKISVGDGEETFKVAFPRNPNEARSLDHLRPLGAEPPKWDARGWALDGASRGVGALYYDNRIALVMSQFENVEESDVLKQVTKYETAFTNPSHRLNGNHVRYWFWQRGSVILMVCAFKNAQNETDLTTALGDASVMGHLHMSPGTAQDDLKAVEQLYNPVGTTPEVMSQTQ